MLLLGGLMLVIICIASVWLGDRTAQYTDALQRAYTLRVGTGRLMNALKDTETGQRGYLLTGNEQYLDPYNAALATMPQAILRQAQDMPWGERVAYVRDPDGNPVALAAKIVSP